MGIGGSSGKNLIKSEFNWYSTADDTIRDVDLSGKIVIVTGANTGIGIETARVLAQHGATVIIGCRDMNKAEAAVNTIKATQPSGTVEAMRLDLASLKSVRDFAAEFKKKYNQLNILINNAGIMQPPARTLTEDGFELQFGVNHLGHFLLFNLLEDELLRGAPSRVVVVSSVAHSFSGIKWDDINYEKSYLGWTAYAQSKTANILFAVGIAKKYEGRGITANALHPGAIRTELSRHNGAFFNTLIGGAYSLGMVKSPVQGAATSVYVATAKELENVSGKYFDSSNETVSSKHASDPEAAERLWELSLKLVGITK